MSRNSYWAEVGLSPSANLDLFLWQVLSLTPKGSNGARLIKQIGVMPVVLSKAGITSNNATSNQLVRFFTKKIRLILLSIMR
jgi:hypothetical protein